MSEQMYDIKAKQVLMTLFWAPDQATLKVREVTLDFSITFRFLYSLLVSPNRTVEISNSADAELSNHYLDPRTRVWLVMSFTNGLGPVQQQPLWAAYSVIQTILRHTHVGPLKLAVRR